MGRPSTYTDEIADRICNRLIEGDSINHISQADDIPSQYTIYKWLNDFPEFAKKYAHARELQAERMLEEIFAIADETSNDTITVMRGEMETEVANNEWINRSRLRVDTRKWAMSKLAPKKYGERVQTELCGPDGGAVGITIVSSVPRPSREDSAQIGSGSADNKTIEGE